MTLIGSGALAVLTALACLPALAAERRPLEPGALLYASPDLGDPNFAKSVVLLVRYEAGAGAMGLIVNRPTRLPVAEALADVKGAKDFRLPLYFGGPVSPEGVLSLVRAPRAPASMERVLENVYLAQRLEDLAAALSREGAEERVRVYAGYAGWAPGQLEHELQMGAWVVRRGDPDKVFARDPARLWPEVHQLLKKIEASAAPNGSRSDSVPHQDHRSASAPSAVSSTAVPSLLHSRFSVCRSHSASGRDTRSRRNRRILKGAISRRPRLPEESRVTK